MTTIKLAFDRSMRRVDQDGRLHVAASNISKATVNPYRGSEIPKWEELGLDPDKVYQLLRDPAELAKAAPTFNNIPVLNRHIAVSVDKPEKEHVVGSTGTDAAFDDPYLSNSLVIWDAVAIAGINTEAQRELSCSYYYDADMTPGKFAGVAYDGIMRNIRGNHVALVDVGRAGHDVLVGDSKLLEKPKMKRTAKAIAVRAALRKHLTPMLAQDAKPDYDAAVAGVTSKNYATMKANIVAVLKPALAADADLADLVELIDALEGEPDAAEPATKPPATDASPSEQLMSLLQGAGLAPEIMEQVTALCAQIAPSAAADEFPPKEDDKDKEKKVDKTAMDAAIKDAETRTVAKMNAIHAAQKAVASILGEVAAMDSAEAIYKLALDHAKIDTTDVHPSAYRAMVAMIPKAGATAAPRTVAMDGALSGAAAFAARFPNRAKGGV